MRQGCRGSFRRTPRRMIRRTPRRPVPRTGSRRRTPARQATAARLRGKFRHALPFRRVAPGRSCPAGRPRRPVPRTGSRRRTLRAANHPAARRPIARKPPPPATGPSGREPPPHASRGNLRHAPRPPRAASLMERGLRPAGPAQKTYNLHQPAFLAPFGRSKRSRLVLRHRTWGTEGKRVPCGHLPPKVAKRPEGGERNERWARSAPSAKIERPGVCPKPRQARREACALWALGPKAQSDPQRGSETMSAPEGSVSPVGCCAQRKATRRCEQIQGLCAAAHRMPIFARAAKP